MLRLICHAFNVIHIRRGCVNHSNFGFDMLSYVYSLLFPAAALVFLMHRCGLQRSLITRAQLPRFIIIRQVSAHADYREVTCSTNACKLQMQCCCCLLQLLS